MRKLRPILRYTTIGLVVVLIILIVLTTNFLFINKAPVISGDVAYGIRYKNDLKLDVYRPTKNVFNTSPVVIYIHGGAWIRGTKAAINFNRFNGSVNILREKGYTIISPDYSLAGKNKSVFPECILDVYEAIEWTKQNASLYGLDTTNLGLFGESAGAHIAMMIAFSETTLQPEKYKRTKFNYLIDVYGPNDLTEIYHRQAMKNIDASIKKISHIFGSEFNIKEYVFGFDPSKDTLRANELLHRFSPLNILSETDFPVLTIHGKNDQIVPVEQSMILKSKLDLLGIPNEIHLMDNVGHIFSNATREQMDSTQLWISDFVVRCYKD